MSLESGAELPRITSIVGDRLVAGVAGMVEGPLEMDREDRAKNLDTSLQHNLKNNQTISGLASEQRCIDSCQQCHQRVIHLEDFLRWRDEVDRWMNTTLPEIRSDYDERTAKTLVLIEVNQYHQRLRERKKTFQALKAVCIH